MNTFHYLIVDGYNIINNWPEFEVMRKGELAHAREHLVEILGDYQGYSGVRVILVFDAHQVKGGSSVVAEKGIKIIYSGYGETADSVIEKLIYELPKGLRIAVATSDWLEQQIVLGKGGIRISAKELRANIFQVKENSRKHYGSQGKPSPLAERLGKDLKEILETWRRR